jgi:hypothetical protein
MQAHTWNDTLASRLELRAALAFWRTHHNHGARQRVRDAIAYVRRQQSAK